MNNMTNILSSLTITDDVTLITLANAPAQANVLAKLFESLKDEVNIDMISMTPPYRGTVNISFTIMDRDLQKAIPLIKGSNDEELRKLRIDINSNNCKLSLFGEGMKETSGVFAKTMSLLTEQDIEIKLITTSEVDISYLIYSMDQNLAVDALRHYFDDMKLILV